MPGHHRPDSSQVDECFHSAGRGVSDAKGGNGLSTLDSCGVIRMVDCSLRFRERAYHEVIKKARHTSQYRPKTASFPKSVGREDLEKSLKQCSAANLARASATHFSFQPGIGKHHG